MKFFKKFFFLGLSTLTLTSLCACGGGSKSVDDSVPNKKIESKQLKYPTLDFKLYMERSGSMLAYDGPHTNGEFRLNVSKMLNSIPDQKNDTTSIYIVNDDVYPYRGSIKDFIGQRDIFETTAGIGNASYTDFAKIFELILKNLKPNQVAVMFSDLIYSISNQENTNAHKLMNEAEALTEHVFKKYPQVCVSVIKFEGGYEGKYYPWDSPSSGIQYNGIRPFYAMVFASQDAMATLENSSKYKEFINFANLPGYKESFCFTTEKYTPPYTVITNGYGKEGRFVKSKKNNSRGEGGVVHSLQDMRANREGIVKIPIGIDLSGIPLPESYKADKSNYLVKSKSGFEIEEIDAIDSEQADELPEGMSHIILIGTSQKLNNEDISIALKYHEPSWFEMSSSADDTNLKDKFFPTTTFAFKSMMNGIYKAYEAGSENRDLFDVSISISKK